MPTDWRSEFFEFEDAYLNAAAQGPMPRSATRAVQQALEWKKFPHKMPDDLHWTLPSRVRLLIAQLIHADANDIAITTGASAGLNAVSANLDWAPGDEVLIARGEFPAHFTAFQPLADRGMLRVTIVEPGVRFVTAADYISRISSHTRLVSASLVRFDDAALLDAQKLACACHQAGALLLLDVAQCAGAMALDVAALEADAVTASGYKWLLSPYGTGFFWARPSLIEKMSIGPFYWQALENAESVHNMADLAIRAARGARRWDSPETGSFLNLSGMAASLDFLLRIGPETVRQHNEKLIAGLIERLPLDRFVLASPRSPNERGTFICIRARRQEKTPELCERLKKAGVIVSLREGALRIAPCLYNTERDIDRLLSVLAV